MKADIKLQKEILNEQYEKHKARIRRTLNAVKNRREDTRHGIERKQRCKLKIINFLGEIKRVNT